MIEIVRKRTINSKKHSKKSFVFFKSKYHATWNISEEPPMKEMLWQILFRFFYGTEKIPKTENNYCLWFVYIINRTKLIFWNPLNSLTSQDALLPYSHTPNLLEYKNTTTMCVGVQLQPYEFSLKLLNLLLKIVFRQIGLSHFQMNIPINVHQGQFSLRHWN